MINVIGVRVRNIALICLALAAATLVVEFLNSDSSSGKIDLVSFWLSARCFVAGSDPYICANSPLALETAESLSYALEMVNPPYNPPLLFPLIAPLALFSFERASAFWLVFSLAIFVWAILSSEREGAPLSRTSEKALKLLVYLSFFPIMVELYFGQISPLILGGFILYYRHLREQPVMSFRGGLALSITLVKPHLLHLIYVDLILRAVALRQWKAVAGFMCGATLLAVVALSVQPDMLLFYQQLLARTPIHMYHPTLSSWVQILSGNFSFWLRCLPAFILWSLLAARYFFSAQAAKQNSTFLLGLLPWSLLTSPYSWVTDQVLLLPLIALLLSLAGSYRAHICSVLIASHIFALSGLLPDGMHYFVWYPLLVAALYLGCTFQKVNKNKSCLETPLVLFL